MAAWPSTLVQSLLLLGVTAPEATACPLVWSVVEETTQSKQCASWTQKCVTCKTVLSLSRITKMNGHLACPWPVFPSVLFTINTVQSGGDDVYSVLVHSTYPLLIFDGLGTNSAVKGPKLTKETKRIPQAPLFSVFSSSSRQHRNVSMFLNEGIGQLKRRSQVDYVLSSTPGLQHGEDSNSYVSVCI